MAGVLSDAQRRPRLILAELVPQYLADYGASVEEVFAFLGQFRYRAELLGPAGRRVSVTAEQVGAGANVVFTLADAQRRPRD